MTATGLSVALRTLVVAAALCATAHSTTTLRLRAHVDANPFRLDEDDFRRFHAQIKDEERKVFQDEHALDQEGDQALWAEAGDIQQCIRWLATEPLGPRGGRSGGSRAEPRCCRKPRSGVDRNQCYFRPRCKGGLCLVAKTTRFDEVTLEKEVLKDLENFTRGIFGPIRTPEQLYAVLYHRFYKETFEPKFAELVAMERSKESLPNRIRILEYLKGFHPSTLQAIAPNTDNLLDAVRNTELDVEQFVEFRKKMRCSVAIQVARTRLRHDKKSGNVVSVKPCVRLASRFDREECDDLLGIYLKQNNLQEVIKIQDSDDNTLNNECKSEEVKERWALMAMALGSKLKWCREVIRGLPNFAADTDCLEHGNRYYEECVYAWRNFSNQYPKTVWNVIRDDKCQEMLEQSEYKKMDLPPKERLVPKPLPRAQRGGFEWTVEEASRKG